MHLSKGRILTKVFRPRNISSTIPEFKKCPPGKNCQVYNELLDLKSTTAVTVRLRNSTHFNSMYYISVQTKNKWRSMILK